jgi:hypothetical protein
MVFCRSPLGRLQNIEDHFNIFRNLLELYHEKISRF